MGWGVIDRQTAPSCSSLLTGKGSYGVTRGGRRFPFFVGSLTRGLATARLDVHDSPVAQGKIVVQ